MQYRLRFAALALLLALLGGPPAAAQDQPQLVELSPLVQRVLGDDLLTDEERRQLQIFHGQWDQLQNLSIFDRTRLTVARHGWSSDEDLAALMTALDDAAIPQVEQVVTEYCRGLLQAGDPVSIFAIAEDFELDTDSAQLRLLLALAHEDLGQYPQAIEQITPVRDQALDDFSVYETAEDLTAAAQAVVMLARLEGRPAADFHLANQMLAGARQLDALYWPAYIAEAELLWAKGNPQEAAAALDEALSLNPRSSEAWFLIGTMRARYFDFETANRAIGALRLMNPEHPLADVLEVQVALRQKDIPAAQSVITGALERYPDHRQLLALNAAVQALTYDDTAAAEALAEFEDAAPGNPLAAFTIGQALSDARQYALAEPYLKAAIEMLPGWSEPQLALGHLYMDWGRLPEAAAQLQTAAGLDPFHVRITNLQIVVSDMLGYETLETEQFIVRYQPGVDEVLARDIQLHMGAMVDAFIARFGHDPPALTQVDLMPDDEHFAVRLTGLPEVWTIAACTGDVIAMTPPRPGPQRSYGAYNWLNVMGHEYAHVVNLSQTDNRVPHWFTEGCAVNMETTGRVWSQYTLLATMYNTDRLFTFDQINWGFIRPTEAHHRPLAYAQSAWLIQYIEQNHGWDKVMAMLDAYRQGLGERETVRLVFDQEPDELMQRFREWAGREVEGWGMADYGKEIQDPALRQMLATEEAGDIDPIALNRLINEHPDRPDLYKLNAMFVMLGDDLQASIDALQAYQARRPVDPWANRELARIALVSGDADTAINSLLTLDRIEGDAPEYAVELAQTFRRRGNYPRAVHFAERALLREPYNATFRELAATAAVQNEDYERAAFHVESLRLLEPDLPIHARRLAVIYERLGRDADAEAARNVAESLDLLDDAE